MPSTKMKASSSHWLLLLGTVLLLSWALTVQGGPSSTTSEELRKEAFSKAAKKATLEKKSELKSSSKLKTAAASSSSLSAADNLPALNSSTPIDTGAPVPVEDDAWEDPELWKDVPENGTVNINVSELIWYSVSVNLIQTGAHRAPSPWTTSTSW